MRNTIIDLIGQTPLVKLRINDENREAAVYAKLEMQNPYGMKDRVAKQMILEAKRTGLLEEGAPIVESSSGTLAMGIAMVGTYLGHDVHIVTDPRIDDLTYKKLKSLGANIHVVNKMGDTGGWQRARLQYLKELLIKYPTAYWPKQYENIQNPLAYDQLAKDIVEQLGKIDYLVGAVGSGGSLCGTANSLKFTNPNLKVLAVDAVGSSVFFQKDRPYRLQGGLGNSLKPKNVDYSVIDDVHWLNDEEAFNWTLELARHEKIIAGNSSGSVYAVARWLSTQVERDKVIACIFPDRGDRYVDTIYDESFYLTHKLNRGNLNMNPIKIANIQDAEQWTYFHFNKGKSLNEETIIY
ncbi:cysteine synthase family protein [Bacillus paranthracis]|uniref:PLP-dependent cysteine synthase family protein n=1 Tax=Bacillus TaxID=1386 RepID=UPI000200F365|nr:MULTISPECIES: cysteine synthase family protein [Bacillus]ADY24342.1 pyridoxal-phosphate dependent enzyme [Bacillus thuringiensis serovar finitimus YBT-020]MCW4575059.1 cysteine synthase family protein [Bacillus pacificus]MDA1585502.1 cysteine synthase family protein [Bacillus cereus group sp. TH230-1LC]MRC72446.1 pyridoxal-phosphate dependent enzyme [Bacillus thuringiensis]OTX73122.1 pyridoxal-5'-phosphate-dependent protein [Bacillus thuringiensis serovar finitimus]